MIHNPEHQRRLMELDTIAQQIEDLDSIIQPENSIKAEKERMPNWLDEEEIVTKEFLQLLEDEEGEGDFKLDFSDKPRLRSASKDYNVKESGAKVFMPDLGKGLPSGVQTRDGEFLAAMNPFDVEVWRKEMPKLAMQLSRPLVLPSGELSSGSGFELFQKMAGIGAAQLKLELQEAATKDELTGKTAEQIVFERQGARGRKLFAITSPLFLQRRLLTCMVRTARGRKLLKLLDDNRCSIENMGMDCFNAST